jgi:bifunctional DNA-binding transcriptional regulator/antitoxin component of YhaV-PrlF toxin-antitoxin module
MRNHQTNTPLPDGFMEWSEWDHRTFATEEERVAYYIALTHRTSWKIVSPVALSWEGWDMWRESLRKEFPVRNFFQITIPDAIRKVFKYKIGNRLHDLKWAFIHRYVPRHQYNVLRPKSLKPGYYDPDMRILHACMDELREYFEKGVPEIDWDATDHHSTAYAEMKEIYNWWVNIYPNQEDLFDKEHPFPDLPSLGYVLGDKHADEPLVIEWRRVAELRRKAEAEWYKTEEEMLIRLMKIRRSMWYA